MRSQIGKKPSQRMVTLLQELYNIQKKAQPDEFIFSARTAFRLCDLYRRAFISNRPCKEHIFPDGFVVKYTCYVTQIGISYLTSIGFI